MTKVDIKSFRQFNRPENIMEAARRSLSRVMHHAQNNAIGIITAHRGEFSAGGRDTEGRTNQQRNEALQKDIRGHGFGFIHLRGRYVENHGTPDARPVDEHSFMVTSGPEKAKDLRSFLVKHGEKYGQDAVLYKHPSNPHATLIGTRGEDRGKETDTGPFHANRMPEYHSVLTRGGGKSGANPRTFAFGENWEGWETFGLFNPLSFFTRKETPFE